MGIFTQRKEMFLIKKISVLYAFMASLVENIVNFIEHTETSEFRN